MQEKIYNTLRRKFKFRDFRPGQYNIIENFLRGRDVLAILPTGDGKSLCYMLPAVLREGTTIVVTPIISLMQDQVRAARSKGIPALYINSTMHRRDIEKSYRLLKSGRLRLLYIAPERVLTAEFQRQVKSFTVSAWVVDEAHCLAEWGAEFRPAYFKAAEYIRSFEVPIAAFTATANAKTRLTIAERLCFKNPYTHIGSFNRKNLYYKIQPKYDDFHYQILTYILDGKINTSGIIYCTTRAETEEVTRFLRRWDISALPYHAGLDGQIRTQNQMKFLSGECRVIVATIAFGMGIDKPDVRFVIHADLPKNIEGYMQETGRAGRDGLPADCIMLFRHEDIVKQRFFVDRTLLPEYRGKLKSQLYQMIELIELIESSMCRRKLLLKYFGENFEPDNCGMCDNCILRNNVRFRIDRVRKSVFAEN